MDQTEQLIALTLATGLGILAMIVVLRRQRHEKEPEPESRFAASTEGEKRCSRCGMGNMWTDRNCISCKARLPG